MVDIVCINVILNLVFGAVAVVDTRFESPSRAKTRTVLSSSETRYMNLRVAL